MPMIWAAAFLPMFGIGGPYWPSISL
jgi:hypothetical protein